MSLEGKKIILAISGSIAAYKSAFLTRLLVKSGAEVRVIMSESATSFISPLTLSTLSKNKVYTQLMEGEAWNDHVEMGIWGDVMIVAPATANTLAKMAQGICDSVLAAVYLSARCPVYIAPAMDLDMWAHPANQRNIDILESDGVKLIPVGHGELASGLSGAGRMAEPEDILDILQKHFANSQDLMGKKILVTAGPTYEAIDPVRFIGNHSSGKMGIALAEELASRGGDVELILGPSKLRPTNASIQTTHVKTAEEMYQASMDLFPVCQVAILAAAVSDYRPAKYSEEKIKKDSITDMQIPLERTPDIASELGKRKKSGQVIVGFALETSNEEANASRKMIDKNMDLIVLNSLRDQGAGFDHNTNKITILSPDNKSRNFKLKPKQEVAVDIVDELVNLLKNRSLIS